MSKMITHVFHTVSLIAQNAENSMKLDTILRSAGMAIFARYAAKYHRVSHCVSNAASFLAPVAAGPASSPANTPGNTSSGPWFSNGVSIGRDSRIWPIGPPP